MNNNNFIINNKAHVNDEDFPLGWCSGIRLVSTCGPLKGGVRRLEGALVQEAKRGAKQT